ncbi:MAG: spore germination protein GerW family protein [Caldilineaceae bacterium]
MNTSELVNTASIEQFVERIGVNKVFGAPVQEGDATIIPVAQVEFGFGYGGGYGHGAEGGAPAAGNADADNRESSEGGGGGGGAGGRSTPRGYIHISQDGVKYTPIVDELRIPLGGLLVGAWSVFWIAMTIRAIARGIVAVRTQKR